MQIDRHICRRFGFAGLFALAFALAMSARAARAQWAEMEWFEGEAGVGSGRVAEDLEMGMRLPAGTVLQTGLDGRIIVRFGDRARISLEAMSVMSILSFGAASAESEQANVWMDGGLAKIEVYDEGRLERTLFSVGRPGGRVLMEPGFYDLAAAPETENSVASDRVKCFRGAAEIINEFGRSLVPEKAWAAFSEGKPPEGPRPLVGSPNVQPIKVSLPEPKDSLYNRWAIYVAIGLAALGLLAYLVKR